MLWLTKFPLINNYACAKNNFGDLSFIVIKNNQTFIRKSYFIVNVDHSYKK